MVAPEPLTIFYTFPVWNVDQLTTAQLKTPESNSRVVKRQEDEKVIDEFCAELKDEVFGSTEVREILGCGKPRADRLIRAALKDGKIKKHEKIKRPHAKRKVQTYKVKKNDDES